MIPATGLNYYGYRFYDSCSGKWTTRDPIEEAGGINLYRAMGNNSVNRKDPTGLFEPVTVFTTWVTLYFLHAGDAISNSNGNVWGIPQDQDRVCSLPGPLGPIANQCVLDRCQRHDACYAENECTASSWVSSALGGTKLCNKCNGGFFR